MLAVFGATLARLSAGELAEEYRVKGAFLLNFAKFVEWPAQSFKSSADPLSICILGANPFGPALETAAKQLVIDGHPVTVRLITEPPQARQCQVVFIGKADRKRAGAVLQAAQGANVLTVGESEGFLTSGGVIEFRVEENKVKMDINSASAMREGLHISAKLLTLAQSGKR
jgi:hypothetical protein